MRGVVGAAAWLTLPGCRAGGHPSRAGHRTLAETARWLETDGTDMATSSPEPA